MRRNLWLHLYPPKKKTVDTHECQDGHVYNLGGDLHLFLVCFCPFFLTILRRCEKKLPRATVCRNILIRALENTGLDVHEIFFFHASTFFAR